MRRSWGFLDKDWPGTVAIGLTTASSLSAWHLTVRAALDGSLVAVKVKARSRHRREAPCTGGQAREAIVERDVGEDEG
jgi:hypothetical protein